MSGTQLPTNNGRTFHLGWMWFVCLLSLAVIAYLRFYLVPRNPLGEEQLPVGIVSLHDPEPAIGGYCYVKFGTWFRLMHDLTCAPLLALYLSALGLMPWRLLRGGRQNQRTPLASWMALVFALFALVYTMSLFTPVRVLGVRLAMT